MIIETLDQIPPLHQTRLPSKILMANPEYYDILYAINPYMKTADGHLNKPNKELAQIQWKAVYDKYLELGFNVKILQGLEGYPDFVFCANQSFPFWNQKTNRAAVIISNMRSDFRKEEVRIFENWYENQGYEIYHVSEKFSFEGNGDAFKHPDRPLIWGGCGPRTDPGVYNEISEITGWDVILVPLTRPEFYHLDTCFSIIDSKTAVVQPDAMAPQAMKLIRSVFENVIETGLEECSKSFTANCHGANDHDVLLQRGNADFEKKLLKNGFNVHALDTSEFLKSGGSVFCMKMMVF